MTTTPTTTTATGLGGRAERHQRHRRARAQGPPARPVLAVVRRQRLGARRSSYGSFVLGFGISFWQATDRRRGRHRVLVPAVRLRRARRQARLGADHGASAGRRSGCAATGCRPSLSWLLTVGWETVLVVAGDARHRDRVRPSSAGAAATGDEGAWRFVVVAALVVAAGVLGFDVIMRLQTLITVVTARADRRSTSRCRSTRSTGTRCPALPAGSTAGVRRGARASS